MSRQINSRNRIARRQPCARDRLWASMRMLRNFTAVDLVATAEAGPANARKYIIGLVNAGYLIEATPKRNGHRGGHAVYRLVRDSGPRAPRLQSNGQTWDPNNHDLHDGGVKQ